MSEDLPYHLFGEEYVGVNVMGTNVIGSYKKEIIRSLDRLALGVLQEKLHQGKIAAEHGKRFQTYCNVVKKAHDPYLTRFALLAVAKWLPSEAILARRSSDNNLGRGRNCKLPGCMWCGN